MGSRFFNPFKGEKYDEGICGKKLLVLGASFYCDKKSCKYFDVCTDIINKDSSKFDTICPEYSKDEKNPLKLSEEPSNAIEERYRAYQNFANFMQQFIEDKNEDVWDRMGWRT